jgi:hypothetical protein
MIGGKKRLNKKGQVTIFIIIAILVVAIGVLFYLFYPKIFPGTGTETKNPSTFIQECMQEEIQNTITNLSLQGGSVNPTFYYTYYDTKKSGTNNVEYLCYTNQDYIYPCVVQRPLLVEHIQSEILNNIKADSITCFNNLKKSYENKGYQVNMIPGNITVELIPKKVVTTFEYELTLTKGNTEKFQNFKIALDSNLYEFAGIANSIINWETQYGDAEVTTYMNYYHDLKVEKKSQIDETRVYILTDRNSGEKFQFASRSYVFPPGMGI